MADIFIRPYPWIRTSAEYEDLRRGYVRRHFTYDDLFEDEKERVDSDDPLVRAGAARSALAFDKLIDDPDWRVRHEVSLNGYGFDKLVNDEAMLIRFSIAEAGWGLDALIKDEDELVRERAKISLLQNRTDIDSWIAAHPDRCALPENRVHAPATPTLKGAKEAQKSRPKPAQTVTAIKQ